MVTGLVHECNSSMYNHTGSDHPVSEHSAAALITCSGALGAVAAAKLSSLLLASLGFTAAGVSGSSFAAWWQSTMPLVAKGSVFAILQSIAMGGAGAGTYTIGSVFAMDLSDEVMNRLPDSLRLLLRQTLLPRLAMLCSLIDKKVEKDNLLAKAIKANTAAVQLFIAAKNKIAQAANFVWSKL